MARHLPPSEELRALAGSAPKPYRDTLRVLTRHELVGRHLKLIGLKARVPTRVCFLPVSVARRQEGVLRHMASVIDSGDALYGTVSERDASESVVVTPDENLDLACIGHELQHIVFTAEGIRRPRARAGTPGVAVEHFHVWVEEAAVTVGIRELGHNPEALDRTRFEKGLRAIDETLDAIASVYCIARSRGGVYLRLVPQAMGQLAGLAYFAGACLGETAAAEVLYRVRKAQLGEPEHQQTLLGIVTEGVTRWSLGTQVPTAAMVEAVVGRFAQCLRWDLTRAYELHHALTSHEEMQQPPPPEGRGAAEAECPGKET